MNQIITETNQREITSEAQTCVRYYRRQSRDRY
jgi:hypothetical protein